MSHFCTCTDHACPFNPHNPAKTGEGENGCDRCIAKCLGRGEIPSCFFRAAGGGERPKGGYTYRDFAKLILDT